MDATGLLRIRLLGGFQVVVGDREVDDAAWRQRKAAALLKLLALAPNHRLHREQLMDALWPESEPEAAANNLRFNLHTARRILGPDGGMLQRDGDLIGLEPREQVWVDVDAFEAAVVQAWQSADPQFVQQTVDLYTGDLLPEDPYEDWAASRRTALRATFLTLLSRLAALWEQRGELGAAIATRQRQVALEPTDEAAAVALIQLYARTGQVRQALNHFEALQQALSLELGVEPANATIELLGAIRSGHFPDAVQPLAPVAEAAPAPRFAFAAPPQPLGEPIGRERELAELRHLLARTRLLNLTGPGGVGKTRLALALAQAVANSFADGVLFVSLEPVQDYRLVLPTIAQHLGIPEVGDQALLPVLAEALNGSHLLLLLDNFEHVIEAGPLIAELLARCPRLTVVTTSRVRLRLRGEQEYGVGPLALPEDATDSRVNPVEAPAVKLFLQRLGDVRPGLALVAGQALLAVEICRRLDGLPLAIELAAARGAVLSMPDLLARLTHPLSLLTGGARDSPARQQTLRNTIAWSYQLLNDEEQAVLRRLAVFVGGWTLQAAEATVALDSGAAEQILDDVESLVEKSLIRRVDQPDGTIRFTMLVTIREFALEQLRWSGGLDDARHRHATYFLDLAEHARPMVAGPEFELWMQRLTAEQGNLREALTYWLETARDDNRHAECALRMTTALFLRFWFSSPWAEGFRWFERSIAAPGPVDPKVRATALHRAALIALFHGQYDFARQALTQSLHLYRLLDDHEQTVSTLTLLGWLAAFEMDEPRALELLAEVEELRPGLDQPIPLTHIDMFHAFVALLRGDVPRAIALFEVALERLQALGDSVFAGVVLADLGLLRLAHGDIDRAERALREALGLERRLTDVMRTYFCLVGLAGVAASRHSPRRAARLWGAAEHFAETFGLQLPPLVREHMVYAGLIEQARGQIESDAFIAAWDEGGQLAAPDALAYALEQP